MIDILYLIAIRKGSALQISDGCERYVFRCTICVFCLSLLQPWSCNNQERRTKKIRDRFNEKKLQKDLENINSLSRREKKRVFHSDFCRINKDAELEHSLAVERLKSEGVVVCPHTSTPSHEPHTGHLPV